MASRVTVKFVGDRGDSMVVLGTLDSISGNYTGGVGNGEPVNFGAAVMTGLARGLAGIPSSEVPIQIAFWPTLSALVATYAYGTTRDGGKLRFWTGPNNELANGAYIALVTGEVFEFEATFRKLV